MYFADNGLTLGEACARFLSSLNKHLHLTGARLRAAVVFPVSLVTFCYLRLLHFYPLPVSLSILLLYTHCSAFMRAICFSYHYLELYSFVHREAVDKEIDGNV